MKVMTVISTDEFDARAADRAGNRDLDRAIQDSSGYRQSSKDAGGAFPRDATGDLRHPAMARKLPIPDSRRRPISARQKNARSKLKREVQQHMSKAQYEEFARLLDSPEAWTALNDELSDCIGNAQELSETSRRRTRRIDRGIQGFETGCGREHLLYARVQLPPYVPQEKALEYVRQRFAAGDKLEFDRYTLATHQMHEHEQFTQGEGVSILLEIETKRGMYLGGSDGRDDTSHLLPRALLTAVAAEPHLATYRRPDGSGGSAIVVQIRDAEPEEEQH
ncbi:MAG: hypothetical protein Q4F67_10490 [Propionibacteriaceae bacterium]|nr:hypothetical protein [Propionibacteriaceae bacterium]